MPYKLARQRNHKYTTSSPNGVKGRNMTLGNAKKQIRLLEAIEHNPEFKMKLRKK